MNLKNFVRGFVHGSSMYPESMIDNQHIQHIDHLKEESTSFIVGDVMGGLTMGSVLLYSSYKFFSLNNNYSIIPSAITLFTGAKTLYDTANDASDFIEHNHHLDINISGDVDNCVTAN